MGPGSWELVGKNGGITYEEEILYSKGDETQGKVSQRGGGSLIHGNIQGWVGQGSVEPDLVDVPAHCREIRLGDL